jgi:hypothetical protein
MYGLLPVERARGRNSYCNFELQTGLRNATIYMILSFVSSGELFNGLYIIEIYPNGLLSPPVQMVVSF